jgi:CRP-like cAMP-binding protein
MEECLVLPRYEGPNVHGTTGNLLLDALSPELRGTILELTRAVDLPGRTLLHEQGETPAHVYFLCTGVASLVVTMAAGGSAEVGLTGHEGVVGGMQLLGPSPTPSQSSILMQGTALRIRFDDARGLFLTSNELRCRILEFVQQQNVTLEQIAACNKLHEAEQRLARWLLMCRDRSEQDTMTLTQEFMADMLGTRRTTVTMVASSLQERGMISYRRGRVTILSHTELAKAACPCYRICHAALRNLYRPHCD